jgi:hypothetical protein
VFTFAFGAACLDRLWMGSAQCAQQFLGLGRGDARMCDTIVLSRPGPASPKDK